MAASLSTIVAKDGAGATVVGGVQALDLSGAATGPWSPANVIVDGTAGTNRAAVKAASTAPVATDPALVVSISPNSVNANGQATMANSAPVVIASNQTAVPVTTTPSACTTGTNSNVASSGSSVTVLASNAARLGASVFNDSTQILYLLNKTGGTASTSAYSVQVAPNGYYEVPFGFTGALIGIWASANGNARVMEYTA